MKLLIGCPIYKRDWIFPMWVAALERQSIPLSDIGFIFETSPNDESTISMMNRWRSVHPEIPLFEMNERPDLPHFEHVENSRQWTMSKYQNMISLRNSLLKRAREIEPEYYLSLDSDVIMKNPSSLELMIGHIKDGADAVNTLMFMTPFDTKFPSVMTWKNDEENRAYREDSYPIGQFFKADVIMAAKMMSKEVYKTVNYQFHVQGEDLGWCTDARSKGFQLYCASYIYSPHIMHRSMLEQFVKQGDRRELILFEDHIKI